MKDMKGTTIVNANHGRRIQAAEAGLLIGAAFLSLTLGADLSEGLAAHYSFEGDGNDSSDNHNHATPMNHHLYEEGVVGRCIRIQGEGYVTDDGHVLLPPLLTGMSHHHGEAYVSFGYNADQGDGRIGIGKFDLDQHDRVHASTSTHGGINVEMADRARWIHYCALTASEVGDLARGSVSHPIKLHAL